jgi:hypothetical protein
VSAAYGWHDHETTPRTPERSNTLYEAKEPLWQFIEHWQTLIAGLLALAAGVGAVWATIKSANREVAAAQGLTKAAQRQTAVVREIERRRVARERYAFHVMLEAAMGAVIADVEAARNLPAPGRLAAGNTYSVQAYAVRQRVKRTGFTELRRAFLHLGGGVGGGVLTAQFLRLDKEIEVFAEQTSFNSTTGAPTSLGLNAGLSEQLDRIQKQAIKLCGKAAAGMKLCHDELGDELINLEP